MVFAGVGIGTTSSGESTLKVGSGTSLFAVDNDGVGIGSTANGFKLHVVGESRFSGSIVATAFTGDGSGLTNLDNDSRWSSVDSGIELEFIQMTFLMSALEPRDHMPMLI